MTSGLDAAGGAWERNARLVRGLDYYRHTAFEFVTDRLGAQGTVLGGGRYDGLIENLGGPAPPAVPVPPRPLPLQQRASRRRTRRAALTLTLTLT